MRRFLLCHEIVLRVLAVEALALAPGANELLGTRELQKNEHEDPGTDADEVHARADGQADAGRDPQARGGSQADDVHLGVEDRAGPQEADAGDDAADDARRVVERPEAVDSGDGEHRRAETHETVCPDTGRLAGELALEADEAGDKAGQRDADERSYFGVLPELVQVHVERSVRCRARFLNG